MLHPENLGPQAWAGVHVTHQTTVAEIFNVDNVGPDGALLSGFDMFRYAGESLDALIREARDMQGIKDSARKGGGGGDKPASPPAEGGEPPAERGPRKKS